MIDLTPLAVPASMQLLSPLLPSPPASILEVGCGRGALAAELQRRGYSVTGVDPAADVQQVARERGVHVLQSRLEDLPDGQYDVVLFTRSLHHVEDLDASLDAARGQVRTGGRMVLEEFATEGVTAAAAAFLYDTVEVLAAAGLAEPHRHDHDHGHGHNHNHDHGHDDQQDEEHRRHEADPLARWNQDRNHLKTRADMLGALGARSALGPITDTETLWRMAASRLTGPDPAGAAAIARTLAGIEKRRIADGGLPALGFVVAGQVG